MGPLDINVSPQIFILVIFCGSIPFSVNIFTIQIIQSDAITRKAFNAPCTLPVARQLWRHLQNITNSQILCIIKLRKSGITDVNWALDDFHHWKISQVIWSVNLRVALN